MDDDKIMLVEAYNFWVPRKISILGTIYEIKLVNVSEGCKVDDKDALYLKEYSCVGFCNHSKKIICIADLSDDESFNTAFSDDETKIFNYKKTLRHECIHAFFNESGLNHNAHSTENFARDEENVDFFAIQAPKMFELFTKSNML